MRSIRLLITASILLLGLAVTATASAQSGQGNGNNNAAHTTDSGTCEGLNGRHLRDCEATQQASSATVATTEVTTEEKTTEEKTTEEKTTEEKTTEEKTASGGSSQHCEVNYGGQYHIVGSVCVTIEGDTLTLDYIMEDGWTINEAHAWVGDDIASAPQTGSGNPRIGHFPYSTTTSATDVITFVMDISELNLNIDTYCETGLIVAAHGVVSKDGHGSETSWAGIEPFSTRDNSSWATYFGISDPCAGGDEDGGPEPDMCPITASFEGLKPLAEVPLMLAGVPEGVDLTGEARTEGSTIGSLVFILSGEDASAWQVDLDTLVLSETSPYSGSLKVCTDDPGQIGS